ncbi:T9SS type A sorting domain-containing protein [Mariniflexile sp. AS56]|uniref:T9SS type A sorting domain-containing protein n=1 Tax=Mariniflexile sp. AS56 TaxID=3063957 RepID=UPI0026F06759|nr:T9SS type A sorting domain-containing protein [Mariniflexile sp. AS56]MDO7174114.1 T9SS type A sorting domain-containing protein [Mariniflexile sp. AS56]
MAYGYNWDGANWVPSDKSTVIYNTNNKIEKIDIEDWNGSGWVIADRDLYVYDSNNNLVLETYESWDTTTSTWNEQEKIEYTVVNGNRTSEKTTYASTTFIENYVYDTSKLMSEFIHPFKDKTGLEYIIEGIPYYNKLLSTNSSSNRTAYNYNSAITLSQESFKLTETKINIFPNPTQGNLTIESSGSTINAIELYSVLGAKVFSTKDTHFNIDFLNRGVYFLNLHTTEGHTISRKIIKN